jgi:hypothetical protein
VTERLEILNSRPLIRFLDIEKHAK